MQIQTESRNALRELIDLLIEVDERWAGPEWNLASAADIVDAHRALMHLLEGGLSSMFESDPAHPDFRRIVTPARKFTGDNPDAIYFDAPISAAHCYTVRGTMDGAIYVSITIETGTGDGSLGTQTAGVINDTQFDVAADGGFCIRLGGTPQPRNWLAMPAGASRITTRHYYEERIAAAANPGHQPVLHIVVDGPLAPPPPPDDAAVAAGIRRAAQFVRSRTLLQAPMTKREPPAFLSMIPNQFPAPVMPGDMGLAAFDAAYSMAMFLLGPEQALVIRGRWPDCRFANLCVWNRFQQTLDYANRGVSLNRSQVECAADGSFRIVLAHRDPAVANWLDSEGRAFGILFWRFFLPTGPIETPQSEVVAFDSLR